MMIAPSEIDWNVPPDPAEIEQLREVAKLPFANKLKWLAQAGRMADHMQKQRERRLQSEHARHQTAPSEERNLRHE